MSGKSTYMRQTALLCLMAQIGSFIPAKSATLPLLDRIFTRVGASDNIAGGQSTFMVEMSETAMILQNATPHSLVILDEIGRGTATADGISLAWAILEKLHQDKIFTLFATHYHELTHLQEQLLGIQNIAVTVLEEHNKISFLHKIITGTASKSYGIYVAQLAGVPKSVIQRAESLLSQLESNQLTFPVPPAKQDSTPALNKEEQKLELLKQKQANSLLEIKDEIQQLDLNSITPLQAVTFLAKLQQTLQSL